MKSHFQFSNKQRNGIFLLLVIIIITQVALLYANFQPKTISTNTEELKAYRKELDSLKLVKQNNSKPTLYPFNPNYITDYKGYVLGMTNEEIDRLLKFRAKNQWVNSAKEFQNITKISDSLFAEISPYFKFPKWVNQQKPTHTAKSLKANTQKSFQQKIDLNIATAAQLQNVYGIGEKLSQRIIDYRKKHKGFIADAELNEIYGLTPEVIENIKDNFTVKTPKPITTYHLNTATVDQLVTIKYIDYEIANTIVEERTLREGFKNVEDLTKIEGFPGKRFTIIKLYLYL